MKFEEIEFFRNATLRICGSLKIEKVLRDFFVYIKSFIPTNQVLLIIYDQTTGLLEIVAHATEKEAKPISKKTHLSKRAQKQIIDQRSIRVRRIDKLLNSYPSIEAGKDLFDLESAALVMDLVIEKKFVGVVMLIARPGQQFTSEHEYMLSLLNEPFAITLTNYLHYRELNKYKDLLVDDNKYLQDELRRISGEEVIGAEFGLRYVMEMVRQVAPLDSPVLLYGETGVGKELIASTIHNLSQRREGPLIKVNCGAIPETLIDSELFGYEKGAFTGANTQKRGRFERANGGTIFLDEIGELSPEAQIRLLRVLQENEIERVGGTDTTQIDIRVIAATHRNLEKMISNGRFREDLYYRLNVFPIMIPPLRNRVSDIPALVQHLIHKKSLDMKLKGSKSLSPGAVDRLCAYRWPGNVRELENAVERALILNNDGILEFKELDQINSESLQNQTALFDDVNSKTVDPFNLDLTIARHIRKVLNIANGKIEGKGGAAELLGINPHTLRSRMKKLGILFGRKVKKSVNRV